MRYSPWRHLAGLPHLRVAFRQLDGIDAFYDPDRCEIVIERRLRRAERRCALAHELAHVESDDEGAAGQWWEQRQERCADRQAAGWLITVDDLAEALMWAQDEREIAEVLDVDVHTVRARLDGLTDTEKCHIDQLVRAKEQSP